MKRKILILILMVVTCLSFLLIPSAKVSASELEVKNYEISLGDVYGETVDECNGTVELVANLFDITYYFTYDNSSSKYFFKGFSFSYDIAISSYGDEIETFTFFGEHEEEFEIALDYDSLYNGAFEYCCFEVCLRYVGDELEFEISPSLYDPDTFGSSYFDIFYIYEQCQPNTVLYNSRLNVSLKSISTSLWYEIPKDSTSDGSYDEGYYEGYDKGYQDSMSDYNKELFNSMYGPLIGSTITCYVEGEPANTGVSFVFNENYEDLVNTKYVAGSYLNFKAMAIDAYYKRYKTSVEDSPNTDFVVDIQFKEPMDSNDIIFKFLAIDSIDFYDYGQLSTTYFSYNTFVNNDNWSPETGYYLWLGLYVDVSATDLLGSSHLGITNMLFNFTYQFASSSAVSFGDTLTGSYTDGYTTGFDNGYDKGKEVSYDSGYSAGFIKGKNEGYSLGYAENNFTLTNLFWTIGGLPFESFKQIWAVDFLGVNLAEFFTGIMLALVALWLIKKVI